MLAALDERRAVHVITNSRALEPERARALVENVARTVIEAVPDARLVLRGDSTLRGHLVEEYLGVRDVVEPAGWPVLLLVPALPSAGRVTVHGVHLLERDGRRVPVAETEFSRDGGFAYSSERLLDWAEERSGGLFAAVAGREARLEVLRRRGGAAVAESLRDLSSLHAPSVLAADAETADDLELIAEGYRSAIDAGASVLVRCAPAFAGVLSGTTARAAAELPSAGKGVLLVCGSYVEQTTRQLDRLLATRSNALVEANVGTLARGDPGAELARLASEASNRLMEDGVAIRAPPRSRPPGTTSLEAGERIARALAHAVSSIRPRPSVIVAKGGITSAVVLREGVGADQAEVLGPVVPGVSRWAARWRDGEELDYLVVPGNVGDDDLLARLIESIVGRSQP